MAYMYMCASLIAQELVSLAATNAPQHDVSDLARTRFRIVVAVPLRPRRVTCAAWSIWPLSMQLPACIVSTAQVKM